MDDMNGLSDKLTGLLTSPEGMAKLQSVMAMLGGGEEPPAPPAAPTPPPPPVAGGLPDLSALTGLLPLLSDMGRETEDTRLLHALRPYLHGERERRLDETVWLLRMLRLVPALQESGLLGGMSRGG